MLLGAFLRGRPMEPLCETSTMLTTILDVFTQSDRILDEELRASGLSVAS